MRGESPINTTPICAGEQSQLSQGDVPYFFHYLPTTTVHAYLAPDTTGIVELTKELTAKTLSYCAPWNEGRPQRRNLEQIMRAGVMQLARTFDPGTDVNIFANGTNLIYEYGEISFATPDGLKVKVRRKSTVPTQ